jgi:uncharacterized protein (DUF1697 family)
MNSYIALLRGINVSGQKKIQMKDLSELFALLGFENIVTYIQSGNVVFTSKLKTPVKIAEVIEKGITKKFGFDVPVLVLEKNELQNVITHNPFIKVKGIDENRLHVTFLSGVPPKENLNKITSIEGGTDKLVITGKEIYLFCPKGYGRTKYTNSVIENKLKVKATTRNWKTVNTLLKLTEAV